MFPIIFVSVTLATISLMTASFVKEEIDASILRRVYATYLKRFKRRKKMA